MGPTEAGPIIVAKLLMNWKRSGGAAQLQLVRYVTHAFDRACQFSCATARLFAVDEAAQQNLAVLRFDIDLMRFGD